MAQLRGTFLTVRQVAQLAGVTERTVKTDIRSGRLSSVREAGRRLIPRAAIEGYRCASLSTANRITVKQLMWLTNASQRLIRNAITAGNIPVVRASTRRLYVLIDEPFYVAPRYWLGDMRWIRYSIVEYFGRAELRRRLQLMNDVGERRSGRHCVGHFSIGKNTAR